MRTQLARFRPLLVALVMLGPALTSMGACAPSTRGTVIPETTTAWVAGPGCEPVRRIGRDGTELAVAAGCDLRAAAAAAGKVWFTTGSGDLLALDAETSTETLRVPVAARLGPLVATADAVWVGDETDGSIVRIDPTTGEVRARVPVTIPDKPVVRLATRDTDVYALIDFAFEVVRIDTSANAVVARRTLCPPSDCRVGDLSVGAGAVWVIDCCSGTARQLDPDDLTERSDRTLGRGLWSIAGSADAVWALRQDGGRPIRLDQAVSTRRLPQTNAERSRLLQLHSGALWFVRDDRELVAIEPETGRVAQRIRAPEIATYTVTS